MHKMPLAAISRVQVLKHKYFPHGLVIFELIRYGHSGPSLAEFIYEFHLCYVFVNKAHHKEKYMNTETSNV